MVAEEIVITLSGGAPWGFRLQGGAEQQEPLQVAKLSHAEAMSLIDTESASLSLKVKRSERAGLSPRQRRTPPHARSPARYDTQEEEETSEMSGYESATDAGLSLQGQWEGVFPRREPLQTKWTSAEHTPNPHTLMPTPREQAEAEGEGDSGFQEAGVCAGLACPPLVSPERAKEALMLGSSQQLVPMVGLQHSPVNDELSATYMDKARRASEYLQVLTL
ncbi:unnamed protein product [Tetraodon nigroviridis]|uniref:(spotted green pufferfish) hypothetical protein n=1 Tax=Tetraodon nigroviridis TaxID=99883 RepID=Q4SV49_TETNG|nr:unnamed protein product [Tetraodon nigroviridis]